MGNTIGIKLLTQHGQEVICDSRAHLLDWELSMVAWFSGCVVRAVPSEHGILTWDEIRLFVKLVGPHWAPTGAIEIETLTIWPGDTSIRSRSSTTSAIARTSAVFRFTWTARAFLTPPKPCGFP